MGKTSHRRFGNTRALPSGRWQARFTGGDGHVHKAPTTFESDELAQAWLASQEVALATGRFIDERDAAVTVATVAEGWRAGLVSRRASTLARDTGYLERYILPAFGRHPVGAIRPSHVAAWVAALQAKARPDWLPAEAKWRGGLAPATVRKAGQLLAAILEAAVADGRLADNPATSPVVKLPTVEAPELRTLTLAEVEKLAAEIDPRYRALVVVACHTGLRIGELCALTAADVDLLRRRITVTRNTVEVSGHLHHGEVKTKAGRRTVPLSAAAVEALTPLVGGAAHRDDLLFTAPAGGFIRLAGWRRRFWNPAVTAAGLEPFRVHDMRHTAVSLWIAAGVDPKAIAAWAGHRSVITVLDRYGHLMPDHADAFLARLDAYVAAG